MDIRSARNHRVPRLVEIKGAGSQVQWGYPIRRFLLHARALQADLSRFGAVVGVGRLAEPGMIQRFPGCDALCRVVDEDPLEQVQEVLEEGIVLRDDFLRLVSSTSLFQSKKGVRCSLPSAAWP